MSIYHKAQCVLHRRFLSRAHENQRYTYSRRTCIDSSLELLRFQTMLYADTGPEGRLRNKKWHTSSLTAHDFLMAGTIITFDLYHGFQLHATGRGTVDVYAWGAEKQQEMLAAIQKSRDIWSELKDESVDAWKATVILGFLLDNLNKGSQPNAAPTTEQFESHDEKQNAAMTLGLLSSGMSPIGVTSPPQFTDPKFEPGTLQGNLDMTLERGPSQLPSPFSMFGQMPDMQPLNLDWVRPFPYRASTLTLISSLPLPRLLVQSLSVAIS